MTAAVYLHRGDGVEDLTEQQLRTEVEICLTNNKRLAAKKGRAARAEAGKNANRFTQVTRELNRRGLC